MKINHLKLRWFMAGSLAMLPLVLWTAVIPHGSDVARGWKTTALQLAEESKATNARFEELAAITSKCQNKIIELYSARTILEERITAPTAPGIPVFGGLVTIGPGPGLGGPHTPSAMAPNWVIPMRVKPEFVGAPGTGSYYYENKKTGQREGSSASTR